MNSKLEEEFSDLCNKHKQEIQDKLEAASVLINEAVSISEKYGLPFYPDKKIMWCTPCYIPESFKHLFIEKWEYVDPDSNNLDHTNYDSYEAMVEDLTGAYGDFNWCGWQVSQTC